MTRTKKRGPGNFKKKSNRPKPTRGARPQRGRSKSKKGRSSSIDPKDLVKRANVKAQKQYQPPFAYAELDMDKQLKKNIAYKKYVKPTEIQGEAIPHLLEGKNMVGIASTGTGKTAAFLIPIIERLRTLDDDFQTLIVLPTRELAMQVETEFRSLTHGMRLFSSTFIGGTSVNRDMQKLRRFHHVVVGTPGRLVDLMQQRALNLRKFEVLVLDEFDRMLDMGFLPDVTKLVDAMEDRNQTLLFSATIEKGQKELINSIVKDPVRITVSEGTKSSDRVNQDVIHVPEDGDRFGMLQDLLLDEDMEKVLLFTETRRQADKVGIKLKKSGITSEIIHGDKSQNARIKALENFRKGRARVLVATDVAARGIDVPNVSHVINLYMPLTMDSYIHRVGRTGRAGKIGQAYTFVG